MQFVDYQWEVLKNDRLPQEETWVRFCVAPKQYENASRGMADILRWTTEASAQLEYYRDE